MFELKNITKIFESETALADVSFTITGGMNYIIGASGSGKTTLLRIISAMDIQYEGEAFYHGKSLKTLSANEKAQLYATEIGFIAQGFHLIEELSVRENILIPTYLGAENSEKQLRTLLKQLGIEKIEHQKVSTLSGGQKQRVAIARELMKNPAVLIADEPTAALDAETAKEIAALLTLIAKERTVIVVTHDTSLIQGKCSVFELDKGVLIKCDKVDSKSKQQTRSAQKRSLSIYSAIQITQVNFKRQLGKMLSLIISMAVAASCLTVNFSGMLSSDSDEAFAELIAKQGNSVLNLDIIASFMGATGAADDVGNSQSVTQDISGLMEQYQYDSRVEGITMISPLRDAVVNLDGKDFIIKSSGQSPVFNEIVAGKNADNSKYEVVLPEAFVKKLGMSNEGMVGKEISFIGTVYNWDTGEPVEMPVSFKAMVSGIADTSYGIELEGEIKTFEHEDSLFLSLAVMKDIYTQAKKKEQSFNFTIRPTSPENFVKLYDELMAKGIVPLGQIELIRDIVGLKEETAAQTGISYTLIAALSVLGALSVCYLLCLMRKKEYAVYRLSGYTKMSFMTLLLTEYMEMFLLSGVLCVISAMLLNASVWLGLALSFGISVLCFLVNCIFVSCVNPINALKTGER